MENEIKEKSNLIVKISDIIRKNIKLLLIILSIIITLLLIIIYIIYQQNIQNNKISETYIKAGIYLSSKDTEKSKILYKEIIQSKHKFYSILSLNNIIENDLEKNNEEVLKLFETLEKVKVTKEQKNLIKLKKALYLKKISKDVQGNQLLKEIIEDNSIWKEVATEASE